MQTGTSWQPQSVPGKAANLAVLLFGIEALDWPSYHRLRKQRTPTVHKRSGTWQSLAMLKLGRLPKAKDPRNPTPAERKAVIAKTGEFQEIFDTH